MGKRCYSLSRSWRARNATYRRWTSARSDSSGIDSALALLFLLAGPGRVQVRSMSVILMPGVADAHERRRHTEWETLADMLTRAEPHMLTTGAISPVEHEAIWWQAYDRLEATTNV